MHEAIETMEIELHWAPSHGKHKDWGPPRSSPDEDMDEKEKDWRNPDRHGDDEATVHL